VPSSPVISTESEGSRRAGDRGGVERSRGCVLLPCRCEVFSPRSACYALPDARWISLPVLGVRSLQPVRYSLRRNHRLFSRRIHQHKYDSIEGFTKKYQCHRLVYYESHQDVHVAIAREKQIKRWRREKKIALIERVNPRWNDLSENWCREMRFRGQSLVETP
jgi:putative endonuclease